MFNGTLWRTKKCQRLSECLRKCQGLLKRHQRVLGNVREHQGVLGCLCGALVSTRKCQEVLWYLRKHQGLLRSITVHQTGLRNNGERQGVLGGVGERQVAPESVPKCQVLLYQNNFTFVYPSAQQSIVKHYKVQMIQSLNMPNMILGKVQLSHITNLGKLCMIIFIQF